MHAFCLEALQVLHLVSFLFLFWSYLIVRNLFLWILYIQSLNDKELTSFILCQLVSANTVRCMCYHHMY